MIKRVQFTQQVRLFGKMTGLVPAPSEKGFTLGEDDDFVIVEKEGMPYRHRVTKSICIIEDEDGITSSNEATPLGLGDSDVDAPKAAKKKATKKPELA